MLNLYSDNVRYFVLGVKGYNYRLKRHRNNYNIWRWWWWWREDDVENGYNYDYDDDDNDDDDDDDDDNDDVHNDDVHNDDEKRDCLKLCFLTCILITSYDQTTTKLETMNCWCHTLRKDNLSEVWCWCQEGPCLVETDDSHYIDSRPFTSLSCVFTPRNESLVVNKQLFFVQVSEKNIVYNKQQNAMTSMVIVI